MIGDRKALLLHILHAHRGPTRAITAAALAEMVFGDPKHDREIRAIITELIVQDGHGEIIAGNGGEAWRGCPPGYFWAEDPHQIEIYYHILVSRYEDIGHRMAAAWTARNRLLNCPPDQESLL